MDMKDVQPGLWVQDGRTVLQVSTVYPPEWGGTGYVTASVMYPIPPRTTVRSFMPPDVARWKEPSKWMVKKTYIAWGWVWTGGRSA